MCVQMVFGIVYQCANVSSTINNMNLKIEEILVAHLIGGIRVSNHSKSVYAIRPFDIMHVTFFV